MVANALGFSFKVSSGVNEIFRLSKDGQWDRVETTAKDYPEINPGEKLVMVTGVSKPYEIDGKVKDPETGEIKTEKVTMIKLEFGILDGRQRNSRYLMSVSFRVTRGTNLGKIIAGIFGSAFNPAADYPPEEIARKPFYMTTKNEKNGDFLNIKFVDARPWDEAIDGPLPTATVTPIPQPAAKPSADEIFSEDL